MVPNIIKPFTDAEFREICELVAALRQVLEKGNFHGADLPENDPSKCNRWIWHNLQLLTDYQRLITPQACAVLGRPLIPSYNLVAMYGDHGILLPHRDREQCFFTIDLCLRQREVWDLFVEGTAYRLHPGEALCFLGTEQTHWRERIQPGNYCDVALLHYVTPDFAGHLE